jgi:mRNA interferase MazF
MVITAPAQGDIVWVNFTPQKGKEIQKVRPAIVLSPSKYNKKTGLALFAPITSQEKGYPFEVQINTQEIQGVVLCDQIRSMDWNARKVCKIIRVEEKILLQIITKAKLLLEPDA